MNKNFKPRRRVLTSLPFQIFIYFGGWWSFIYFVFNILAFVYKGVELPYPARNFKFEFAFSFVWVFLEAPRLLMLSKGNKTESASTVIAGFIIGLPLLAMYIYFIKFQTYVLKIDEITNAISIAFMGLQIIFGALASFRFTVASRYL
mmetsp:Transcript_31286/g.56784  ORF Transcript_31286/g.56784 Transcript_31286/m.56784 type:complete len:147 (+) Transcript_31286:13-453(+)